MVEVYKVLAFQDVGSEAFLSRRKETKIQKVLHMEFNQINQDLVSSLFLNADRSAGHESSMSGLHVWHFHSSVLV